MTAHDDSAPEAPSLVTSVRRFPTERAAERTVEAVLALAPTYETVEATLRECGLRGPRRASALQREAAREMRREVREYGDIPDESAAELETFLRDGLQAAVDHAMSLLPRARDMVFQMERISAQTSVEERLSNPEFRARRLEAGRLLDEAWQVSQCIAGGWSVALRMLEACRARDTAREVSKPDGSDVSEMRARKEVLASEKVVLLSAWKNATTSKP
ncbi:hypothetical protein K2X14_14075 [Acetobacter sp. TBRC 12305]|uniref:Uncharacterized protein n=1 Tax=Acetobacter garciniae TaxID=2817435 RepID=A0A939KS24_9PROT|nr:hypothetical protein [Acetobacter garciniae]MBO1326741.1 hypothetical protein [Acetobacter garciniae]MBX0345961.1 hypothetical protein [Acetobacter garciniae]